MLIASLNGYTSAQNYPSARLWDFCSDVPIDWSIRIYEINALEHHKVVFSLWI